MIYLKIKEPQKDKARIKQEGKKDLFSKFKEILYKIWIDMLPISNKGLARVHQNICFWYLEFENDYTYAIREIGLDINHNPLIAMPNNTDYGFWTDIDMAPYEYEKSFETSIISEEEFNRVWNLISRDKV